MASAELGGLGAKEGAPVTYDWSASNLMPLALPWLAVLLLLGLKPNRGLQSWWIWVPLACLEAVGNTPTTGIEFLASVLDPLLEIIGALGFGLAAVWLLSTYLQRTHPFLTFLGLLFTLAGVSVSTFLVRQGSDIISIETLEIGILIAACVLVISVGLALAALLCRGRYSPFLLLVGLIVSLLAVWLMAIAPFFFFALMAVGAAAGVAMLISSVLVMAGISFVVVLPFLVLSFANTFFRNRFKNLLRGRHTVVPPPLPPPPPIMPPSPTHSQA